MTFSKDSNNSKSIYPSLISTLNPIVTRMLTMAAVATLTSVLAHAEPISDPDGECANTNLTGYEEQYKLCRGNGYVWIRDYNKVMLINSEGEVIIPLGKYDYILNLDSGLAPVGKDVNNAGRGNFRIGFVNLANGKEVIPLKYESVDYYPYYPQVNTFSEGLITMKLPSGKWGHINTHGDTVIPFDYDFAGSFHEGLAPVCKLMDNDNQKCGYINKSNETVIPFQYSNTDEFSDGLAVVYKYNLDTDEVDASAINPQGKLMFPFKSNRLIGEFSEGLAPIVQMDKTDQDNIGRLGFINHQGELVIPYSYILFAMHGLHYPKFVNGKAQVFLYNQKELGDPICIDTKDQKVGCSR